MRILLKNLRQLPYSLDIGDFEGLGDCVRELLATSGTPGDTVDIGGRVDPWSLNVQKLVRGLVVPAGSTRVVTTVPGGYQVTATPPGQLRVTFLEDLDDLMFLFFGQSGSGMPPATSIGQVLCSTNGTTFAPQQPLTCTDGWLVNDEGHLLVVGDM